MAKKMKLTLGVSAKAGLLFIAALVGNSAYAANTQDTPGKNFPVLVRSYLLQSFDEQQKPNEIAITPSLKNRYFYSNCYDSSHCDGAVPPGAIIFKAPSGFGSTAHSEFPRAELRAKHNFVNGEVFNNQQSGSLYVVKNPKTKSIIVAQIHGDKPGGSEMFKLRWVDGAIVAGTKAHYGDPEKRTVLLEGLHLNQKIDYNLQAEGTGNAINLTITASAGGQSKSATFSYPKSSWQDIQLYFKAGNYNQDHDTDGSEAVVAYSALSVSYH